MITATILNLSLLIRLQKEMDEKEINSLSLLSLKQLQYLAISFPVSYSPKASILIDVASSTTIFTLHNCILIRFREHMITSLQADFRQAELQHSWFCKEGQQARGYLPSFPLSACCYNYFSVDCSFYDKTHAYCKS